MRKTQRPTKTMQKCQKSHYNRAKVASASDTRQHFAALLNRAIYIETLSTAPNEPSGGTPYTEIVKIVNKHNGSKLETDTQFISSLKEHE